MVDIYNMLGNFLIKLEFYQMLVIHIHQVRDKMVVVKNIAQVMVRIWFINQLNIILLVMYNQLKPNYI